MLQERGENCGRKKTGERQLLMQAHPAFIGRKL
jgi:hypothetical protein